MGLSSASRYTCHSLQDESEYHEVEVLFLLLPIFLLHLELQSGFPGTAVEDMSVLLSCLFWNQQRCVLFVLLCVVAETALFPNDLIPKRKGALLIHQFYGIILTVITGSQISSQVCQHSPKFCKHLAASYKALSSETNWSSFIVCYLMGIECLLLS